MVDSVKREAIDLFKVSIQSEIDGLKRDIKSLGNQIKMEVDRVNNRLEKAAHNSDLLILNSSGELQTLPHSYDLAVARLTEAIKLLDDYNSAIKYRKLTK